MRHASLDYRVDNAEQVADRRPEQCSAFLRGFLGLGCLDFDNIPAGVRAAGGADVVRQFGAMALRAFDERRRFQTEVRAPLALACFSVFSLG